MELCTSRIPLVHPRGLLRKLQAAHKQPSPRGGLNSCSRHWCCSHSAGGKVSKKGWPGADPGHAGFAVWLPASGSPSRAHPERHGPGEAQPRADGADPRHAHQGDRHLAGADAVAGGRRRARRGAPRSVPHAAIRHSGRRAAPRERPGPLPAARARGQARSLLRPGGLPRGGQQLQTRHPRAPVRRPEPGLRLHRAPLQPAVRAAPAAPWRLRQLRRARRPPLEVPGRPPRLAGRPSLHRGPRRGGPRRRGRPRPRRHPGQRGERQRGAQARLLRGGRGGPRGLGASGAGARGAQEEAARQRAQDSIGLRAPARIRSPPPALPRTPHAPRLPSALPSPNTWAPGDPFEPRESSLPGQPRETQHTPRAPPRTPQHALLHPQRPPTQSHSCAPKALPSRTPPPAHSETLGAETPPYTPLCPKTPTRTLLPTRVSSLPRQPCAPETPAYPETPPCPEHPSVPQGSSPPGHPHEPAERPHWRYSPY